MINRILPLRALCLAALLLGLAACEDSEDRAARHLENAEALVAEGDLSAAVLEFRNVLKYVPDHREALTQLAELQMSAGTEDAAFGTYQRLVDNHPNATEGWLTLAEIAIRRNRWEDAASFAEQTEAQAPDSDRTALIRAALDFRAAVEDAKAETAADAAAIARSYVSLEPDSLIARQILIGHAGTFLGPEDALAEIDAALDELPGIYALHQLKVQTIAELGRADAIGPALEAMAQRFPDRTEPQQSLLSWYMQQDDLASAEDFLRGRTTEADSALSSRLTLVDFLREIEGVEAAIAELDRQIADMSAESDRDTAVLRGLRATLLFEGGEPDVAIVEIRDVLADLEAGSEANNLRVALARMLAARGRESAAMGEVEAVLAQDSGHVEAIKIKARRLIDADETDAAVRLLRQGQATAPEDAELVQLMGDAHARAGNWDLAGERYSTAVNLAENAPVPSRVYAEFLLSRGRPGPAETVLVDALRQAPTNLGLLVALSELHLHENRLDQVRRVVAQLRALGSEQARRAAESTEANVLLRENRTDKMLALVEQMAAEGRGDADTLTGLIQAQIAEGNIAEAIALIERQREAYPDDPLLKFLRAGLHLIESETEIAEAIYREILTGHPGAAPPLRVLHGLLRQQGRDDEAQALLEETQAAAPGAVLPRLLMAEQAERRGNVEAAIKLYEGIYADSNDNLVVANNLANLLMTRKDDPEALDRAHTVARRLRDTDVPAFQDTYGWIAHLRGDHEEALTYLEPAAEALPEEPTVLYHLGMTYLALERTEKARTALERTLELAGDPSSPETTLAREALDGL